MLSKMILSVLMFLGLALADVPCMNSTQKSKFESLVAKANTDLRDINLALEAAAVATHNATRKAQIKFLRKIVISVQNDIMKNATAIVEDLCGDCNSVVVDLEVAVAAIEKTLIDIEPDWSGNPLYKLVVTALQDILGAVDSACPKYQAPKFNFETKDDCLNATQKQQLKTAISIIDKTLKLTVISLDAAAFKEKDPQTKANLKEAAKIIAAVDTQLVANLTKIVEESCGTCLDIVKAISDTVSALEATLTKIEPDWQNNPIFVVVVDAIQTILDIVKLICPSFQGTRKWFLSATKVVYNAPKIVGA